jgi:16S rRNA G1207 methylase RsmC
MPETSYDSPTGTYELIRTGASPQQALKAWDAADEYLISTISRLPKNTPIAILNDQFGALGTCLHSQTAYWVSDSYCAHQALKNNLETNHLEPSINHLNPLEDWPLDPSVKVAIIRLPKNLSYLNFLLNKCQDLGILEVHIAGMMKHLPKTILQFLQKFGDVDRQPFKKKSTVYQLRINKKVDCLYPKKQTFEHINLITHANVFGRDKLDPGAAFVLKNIKELPNAKNVADLCSGSGILGLAYLKQYPSSDMHFFDESFMAISSSAKSSTLNNIQTYQSSWTDGLQSCSEKFDLIICNPPFHEEHTVGDHIAKRLFKDAKEHLNTNGALFVIANRHLGYHVSLKKYFKTVSSIASNGKFVL